METEADRLASIKALGGRLIPCETTSFWAIFDREYASADSVETKTSALTARTSDVENLPKDTVFTIDGELYRIKRHEPDGSGMTALILRR